MDLSAEQQAWIEKAQKVWLADVAEEKGPQMQVEANLIHDLNDVEVLTDQARIKHAEIGTAMLVAVGSCVIDDDESHDHNDLQRMDLLIRLAHAHFAAAGMSNVSRAIRRSNTPSNV